MVYFIEFNFDFINNYIKVVIRSLVYRLCWVIEFVGVFTFEFRVLVRVVLLRLILGFLLIY